MKQLTEELVGDQTMFIVRDDENRGEYRCHTKKVAAEIIIMDRIIAWAEDAMGTDEATDTWTDVVLETWASLTGIDLMDEDQMVKADLDLNLRVVPRALRLLADRSEDRAREFIMDHPEYRAESAP